MTELIGHTSVLLQEVIDGLNIKMGDVVIDGTLGNGGHSFAIAERFGKSVQIVGLDMDADALARSEKRFEALGANANITFIQANFRDIDTIMAKLEIKKVDRILLDIGLSSNQLEESGRGFSFQKDEPLEMTFLKNPGEDTLTAKTIVNQWSAETLETIIRSYGEERYAKKIAQAIVRFREETPIKTTAELVSVILAATPAAYKRRKIHAATKTFQALRIAVNDELQALQEGLKKGIEVLSPGGRMAVIAFHSLEDRIVKHFFRDIALGDTVTLITKRPITPGDAELEHNRRSRSAKLRIIEKN